MARLIVIAMLVALATPVGAQNNLPVPYSTLAAGDDSAIKAPLHRVVRERQAWLDLWRLHAGERPAPAVDFSRDIVIAVFAGETDARGVTIRRIIREPRRLLVMYALGAMRPLPDGPSARFSPFHIVQVARSPLHIDFLRMKRFPVVVPRP